MAVRFRAAAGTHLGTVRMNNEDSAVVSEQLLVLADGMGGHAAGEVASVLAVRVFSEVDHAPGTELNTNVIEAGRQTRRALVAMSDADPVLESLGTTLVTVVSNGDTVVVGHIGDSRVYLLRQDAMYQITTDHTHVQRMIESGQLTPDQARTHPYRAMLLKSLDDHSPGPDLDLIEITVRAGDRLLLCSDGLSDYLSAEQIGQALATADRTEAVEALIDSALQAATRDNVTVIVADVAVGEPAEPLDAPAAPAYAGAVLDGIRLSEPAARALAEALPGLVLDPREPWRGSTLLDEAVDQDRPVDLQSPPEQAEDAWAPAPSSGSDEPSADAATQGARVPAGEQSGGDTGTVAGAADDARAATTPRAHTGTTGTAMGPPAAGDQPGPDQPSVLPGVLAGAFTIAALVLFTLFLLG